MFFCEHNDWLNRQKKWDFGETTETKDDDIFANAKPISEPSALEKLEYGFDKNPWVARQLLYDIPMNYLTAMFDSERDVKDVAIDREKKLLVHKIEIKKIREQIEEKGKTIIPLNLYYKNGRVKIKFAIAKGRKLWDKRNYKKEQDINREINKSLKGKIF